MEESSVYTFSNEEVQTILAEYLFNKGILNKDKPYFAESTIRQLRDGYYEYDLKVKRRKGIE